MLIQHLEGMIQLLLVSFPFAGILFAPSSLGCLFNGRAFLLGKSLREIAKTRFNNLSKVIG